jgi:hypothetical protein
VEDQLDLELRQDAFERGLIEDRTDGLALNFFRLRRFKRRDVERDNAARAIGGQPVDQAVTDFAGGTSNEDDGFYA